MKIDIITNGSRLDGTIEEIRNVLNGWEPETRSAIFQGECVLLSEASWRTIVALINPIKDDLPPRHPEKFPGG